MSSKVKKCPWIKYTVIDAVGERMEEQDCVHSEIRSKNKCLYCLLNFLSVRLERIETTINSK